MTLARVVIPVADLRRSVDGGLDSQLLFGEAFQIDQVRGEFSHGVTACGYHGWLRNESLGPDQTPTHRVAALATYAYTEPDLKSAPKLRLPYGALVSADMQGDWAQTPVGYIFARHLTTQTAADFVAEAERFIGIPYLWGGRSSLGLDCSALVQLSMGAAGQLVPRDSGAQVGQIGTKLRDPADLQRGDLVFWPGHVGIMRNATDLLHATANTMSVTIEPLAQATARIQETEGTGILAIRRALALA